jgi:hypothetical protein
VKREPPIGDPVYYQSQAVGTPRSIEVQRYSSSSRWVACDGQAHRYNLIDALTGGPTDIVGVLQEYWARSHGAAKGDCMQMQQQRWWRGVSAIERAEGVCQSCHVAVSNCSVGLTCAEVEARSVCDTRPSLMNDIIRVSITPSQWICI